MLINLLLFFAGLTGIAFSVNTLLFFLKNEKSNSTAKDLAIYMAFLAGSTTAIIWWLIYMNKDALVIRSDNWVLWAISMTSCTIGALSLSVTSYAGVVIHITHTYGGKESNKYTIIASKAVMIISTLFMIMTMTSITSELYQCSGVRKLTASVFSVFKNYTTVIVSQWITVGAISLWLSVGRKKPASATTA